MVSEEALGKQPPLISHSTAYLAKKSSMHLTQDFSKLLQVFIWISNLPILKTQGRSLAFTSLLQVRVSQFALILFAKPHHLFITRVFLLIILCLQDFTDECFLVTKVAFCIVSFFLRVTGCECCPFPFIPCKNLTFFLTFLIII